MKRAGTVVAVDNGWATVEIRGARCADCPGLCGVRRCHEVRVRDAATELSPGDRVTITSTPATILRHVLWVYGVGLVAITAFAALGDAVAGDWGTVVALLVAIVASMWMIKSRVSKESLQWTTDDRLPR